MIGPIPLGWLLKQILKDNLRLILMLFGGLSIVFLTGCATTVTKKWTVHPDDMPQFKAQQKECSKWALTTRDSEQFYDNCMQSAGFKLEIIKD